MERFAGEGEHLVAVGSLEDGNQGLGVKRRGHYCKFANRALKLEDPKKLLTAKDRQSVPAVLPEQAIFGELMKWIGQVA